jgi:MFS family permease
MRNIQSLLRLGKAFLLIWFGQMISSIGTSMMRFAYILWAYQQDGQAATIAMLGFIGFVLNIVLSPLAGVMVDRVDRRLVMLLANVGAGLTIGITLALHLTNHLQIWHLYFAEGMLGAFDAFLFPAFTAATTMLVPKSEYARTSGLRSFAASTSQFCAPFLAGLLLAVIYLDGVMFVDIMTYGVAILTLMVVAMPHHREQHNNARGGSGSSLASAFVILPGSAGCASCSVILRWSILPLT